MFSQEQDIMAPNVAEGASYYDSIVICSQLYGGEANVPGWFTTFPAFGGQERHSFFNVRNEASAHLAYTNKQTIDSLDFGFEAYSFGCGFWGPGVRVLHADTAETTSGEFLNTQIAHFWEVELPRYCSIEFKVQQDTILELPAMAASPGYGPSGGGASFDHPQVFRIPANGTTNPDYHPLMNMAVTQGVPSIKNRFAFKKPIQIPRTANIEAILTISPHGREMLKNLVTLNPLYIFGGISDDPPYETFPARFGVTVSLIGKRLVQSRGQWHV